jgi:hypothetical protein
MKKIFTLVCLVFVGITYAQTEAEMKAYMDYLTPGKMHEHLAISVGNWDYTQKMWSAPGTEPTLEKGTAKGEMILGGRYLQMTHEGNAWGMPFQAIQLFGFDNAKQEFLALWIDNMGTGFAVSSGKLDPSKPYLEMFGSFVDPLTKSDMKFKVISKCIDNDHNTMEMFVYPNDQEFLLWETNYSRKK